MFLEIKKRIEKELKTYISNVDSVYHLSRLSPILFENIKEFISRGGKRVRPVLFCIGYLAFAKKPAPGLFRSAISLELLHDFMLVHDDIIDKSKTRRGKPSMHTLLNKHLAKEKQLKFNGEDLSIVIGDVMYALALDAFLSVKEKPSRKELALRKLISAALYTGSGEFIELILGIKPIEKVSRNDIYKIYDYKTANYTFASPLTMGATLAGADKNEIDKLFKYGMCLGRAFQIKDDIIGTFSESAEIGKSNLTDIAEGKKTILIWYAYNHANTEDKITIKKLLSGRIVNKNDLLKIREIMNKTGSLNYAKKEIATLLNKSDKILEFSKMKSAYRTTLRGFSSGILKV
jgi:geranylgeranyl diphosphate synthase type I